MEKRHFIALADMIREYNSKRIEDNAIEYVFDSLHIKALADFCEAQNPSFKRDRWMAYIAGEVGRNGGKVKPVQRYEYEVQGNYGSWECVTTEDDRKEALARLQEYRDNEKGIAFRVVKVKQAEVTA